MTEYIGYLDEDHAPVVDMAQEVVRCRDCANAEYMDVREWHNGSHVLMCKLLEPFHRSTNPDGFCAWAERKREE